ncbi:U32 family peptidase [Acidaminobacter sp. JC074]|uniref:peptidase U32 family protein n=1 Tax=Acidaminobacter sp. JC074 TaxID=2530199 RepID=UPI001F0F8239|nr:U32 family peptidase [Acidaminobacter sp. JC074]MCH4888791.1 U32 family peptidase [Acidaminobacter sp. JC074]
MNKIELLAPAGDLQKLKFAIIYGADAVYIGGQIFGMREKAKNFSLEDMKEGVAFAHERGKKVYMTLNIIPHNDDLKHLESYLKDVKDIGFDAVIVSDPGTLMYIKEYAPELEVHLSTQANNTNYMSAKFWHGQGISRVILARELSFDEIKEISDNIPETLELEAFVHGAMCISYSGRCLLSNYMTDRDANRGSCAHACRWKYKLVEEKRPDEAYPVVETEEGTFFFNSKDLCMIEFIPELINSGLSSLKIEGRMKSVYYVANIVRVYREAIDKYYENPEKFSYDPMWLTEIQKASHRKFTTGFYYNKPTEEDQLYTSSSYDRYYNFTGIVIDYDEKSGYATIEQRNKIEIGDELEVMQPGYKGFTQKVTELIDHKGVSVESVPHAQQIFTMKMNQPVKAFDILRMRKDEFDE